MSQKTKRAAAASAPKKPRRKEVSTICLDPAIREPLMEWLKTTNHKTLSGFVLFHAKGAMRRNAKAFKSRGIKVPGIVFDR